MSPTETTLLMALVGVVTGGGGYLGAYLHLRKSYVHKSECDLRHQGTDGRDERLEKRLDSIETQLRRGNELFLALIPLVARGNPDELKRLLAKLGNGNGSKV
jgi:hypothetical protein